jgi:DnaK suppressor protein
MAKKKDKKAKAAVKSTKKASKPAAKKAVKKVTKPAKKAAKPVAKKVVKKPAKASKPVKLTPKAKQKPQAKKVAAAKPNKNKPVVVKKTVKKEVKKIVSKKSKEEETKLKKKAVVAPVVKAAKKEKPISKKAGKKKSKKSDDGDLEGEELDVDAGLLEIDPEAITDDEEEIEEVIVEEKEKEKKGKGRRRSRGGRIGMKKQYDSEEFVRKQVIKIDLTKALIKKPKKEEPKPFINNKDTRTRYNDKELNEFKEIIVFKLNEAKTDYDLLKQTLTNTDNHGTDDTSPTFKLLEDGSDILSKEEVAQLASRQEKYIVSLQNALVRIQNKTYGICRVTGRLIPKERLRSVPHATLSMDAKINQYDS